VLRSDVMKHLSARPRGMSHRGNGSHYSVGGPTDAIRDCYAAQAWRASTNAALSVELTVAKTNSAARQV